MHSRLSVVAPMMNRRLSVLLATSYPVPVSCPLVRLRCATYLHPLIRSWKGGSKNTIAHPCSLPRWWPLNLLYSSFFSAFAKRKSVGVRLNFDSATAPPNITAAPQIQPSHRNLTVGSVSLCLSRLPRGPEWWSASLGENRPLPPLGLLVLW